MEAAMRIAISAGHSKDVRGAAGPAPWGLDEVNEARRVTARVGEILNAGGVPTKTWWDDVSKSQSENLGRICDWHNAQSRDIDVSIHFNAYQVTTSKPMGVEVLYVTQQELAKRVCDAIVAACDLPNRGAKLRSDLAFLNNTDKPAVLVETCFVDAKIDADTFRRAFEPVCLAIAEGLAGQELGSEPAPPEAERPPVDLPQPPAAAGHPTIAMGDHGPAVEELQAKLGVLTVDGDFGPTSDTWVRAFQAAAGLGKDGVVGPQTWAAVDDLQHRVNVGEPPLPKAMAEQIYTMAQTSEIADYSWPDRGIPPPGYIAGMALSFAVALRRAEAGDDAAKVMAKELGNTDKDALAWYKTELTSKGLKLGTWDERLLALFTLMIGLGPRESSGKYCEGRDLSASNVEADTAEASLVQTSWNIRSFSSAIGPLLPEYWENPGNGFLHEFKEGITATKNNLDSFGSGDGARYQFLSRFCPLFHLMVSAVGLRTGRQHWGPIGRREVTIKKEAADLLRDVQKLVESVA
jgi:hypothetical protein